MSLVNPFGEVVRPANLDTVLGKKKVEFLSIQYLRAFAALGVVLVHASTSLLPHERMLLPLNVGNLGVDLFFVISGFLMFYTTVHKSLSAWDFYIRRMIRVVPMYFLATTFAFAVAVLLPHFTRTFSPRIADYVRSILFIPYYNSVSTNGEMVRGLIRPEVGQGWTLNYEVFFYLVFGLCLGLSAQRRVWALVGWALCMTTVGLLWHPANAVARTYTDPLLLEFVAGVLLAYLIVRGAQKIRPWMGVLMALAGVSLLVVEHGRYTSGFRFVMFGVPAVLIVGGALCMELEWQVPDWRLLLLLGNASYSLYLFHIFVLAVLRRVWQRHFDVSLVPTHLAFVATGVLVTECVGVLIYLLLEKRITIALNETFKRATAGRRRAQA